MDGEKLFINPENFFATQYRGGIKQPLKDSQKWVPLGIGSGEDDEQSETEDE